MEINIKDCKDSRTVVKDSQRECDAEEFNIAYKDQGQRQALQNDRPGMVSDRLLNISTTLGLEYSVWGRLCILCIVGCSAASLASTHQMPIVAPYPMTTKYLQTLSNVSWGTKSPLAQKYCCRDSTLEPFGMEHSLLVLGSGERPELQSRPKRLS